MQIDCGPFSLREFRLTDKESMARYANNRKIWRNVRDRFPFPYHVQDAEDFLRMYDGVTPVLNFCIELNGECIGAIGIVPQPDVYRRSAEIGYWLGEPFWGKGIVTRAVQKLTDHVFGSFDLVRLYAGIFAWNTASMRVLEKAGYHLESINKNAVFKDNELVDEYRYVRLKNTEPGLD